MCARAQAYVCVCLCVCACVCVCVCVHVCVCMCVCVCVCMCVYTCLCVMQLLLGNSLLHVSAPSSHQTRMIGNTVATVSQQTSNGERLGGCCLVCLLFCSTYTRNSTYVLPMQSAQCPTPTYVPLSHRWYVVAEMCEPHPNTDASVLTLICVHA